MPIDPVENSAPMKLAPRTNARKAYDITPTPTDADASVPGSTDGIMWMGVVIALIVLVPMLTTRALWARQA